MFVTPCILLWIHQLIVPIDWTQSMVAVTRCYCTVAFLLHVTLALYRYTRTDVTQRDRNPMHFNKFVFNCNIRHCHMRYNHIHNKQCKHSRLYRRNHVTLYDKSGVLISARCAVSKLRSPLKMHEKHQNFRRGLRPRTLSG